MKNANITNLEALKILFNKWYYRKKILFNFKMNRTLDQHFHSLTPNKMYLVHNWIIVNILYVPHMSIR